MTEQIREQSLLLESKVGDDSSIGGKKYIHIVSSAGNREIPGHASIIVTDEPYCFNDSSDFWDWPTPPPDERNIRKTPFRFKASLEKKKEKRSSWYDSIVCIGAIKSEDYQERKKILESLFGYTDKNFLGHARPGIKFCTFKGKKFSPFNNCLDFVKEGLLILSPEHGESILRSFYGKTPGQLVAAASHYVHQQQNGSILFSLPKNGFFPSSSSSEFKLQGKKIDTYHIRWRTAEILYDDELVRRRNLLIFISLLTITPSLTLSSYFLGDEMPTPIPIDDLSNTVNWSMNGSLVTLFCIVSTWIAIHYLRTKNPYQGDIRIESPFPQKSTHNTGKTEPFDFFVDRIRANEPPPPPDFSA